MKTHFTFIFTLPPWFHKIPLKITLQINSPTQNPLFPSVKHFSHEKINFLLFIFLKTH